MGWNLPFALILVTNRSFALALGPTLALTGSLLLLTAASGAWLFFRLRKEGSEGQLAPQHLAAAEPPAAIVVPAPAATPEPVPAQALHPAPAIVEVMTPAKPTAAPRYSPSHSAHPVGAGPLLAQAASLLPRPTMPAARADIAARKPRANASGDPVAFQPGARFSRSQQAFLHVPVVLSGTREDGTTFREENRTLILLPQGAVIRTALALSPNDRLTLLNQVTQQEVLCRVFGILPGPDGKAMIEAELVEPLKNFWPVSFPAWSEGSAANFFTKKPAGAADRCETATVTAPSGSDS